MHLTPSSPVQRQLRRDQTLHPSVNYLLFLRAKLPLSFRHVRRPSLFPHPLPALIPSYRHPYLLQKFPITQLPSCNNLSKPARQLKKQNALRRNADRSVFYKF